MMEYRQNEEKDTPSRDSNYTATCYWAYVLPLYQKGYLTLRCTDVTESKRVFDFGLGLQKLTHVKLCKALSSVMYS